MVDAVPERSTVCENPAVWYGGGLLVVLVWTGAWYIQGADRYVRIHDGLNSNVTVMKVTASSDVFLANSGEPIQQIAGVPRHCSIGELFLPIWFYRFLPTLWAYAGSEFFTRVVAHAGSFLLIVDFVWPNGGENCWFRLPLITTLSISFALLPFWIPGGLDVAGQPLLFWAILRLYQQKGTAIGLLVSVAFTFFSSVVLSGIFILLVVFTWWFLVAVFEKKLCWRVLTAFCLLLLGWLVSSYRLFEGRYSDPDFVSMRSEYVDSEFDGDVSENAKHGYTASLANWEAKRAFFSGNDSHAPPKHNPFVLATVVAAGSASLIGILIRIGVSTLSRQSRILNGQTTGKLGTIPIVDKSLVKTLSLNIAMAAAVFACALTSFWLGWYRTPFWGAVIKSFQIGLLNEINLARFHWFQPLLWLIAFTFAIRILLQRRPVFPSIHCVRVAFVFAMIGCHLVHLTFESEYCTEKNNSGITFREYYAKEQFDQIKKAIGRNQSEYRVASVGLHPTVAQENGFYTIDGFLANYPLSHKKAMEKVLHGELTKNRGLKQRFDSWGAQFYLFSAELVSQRPEDRDSGSNLMYTKNDSIRRIENFDIDVQALREMGVEFLFSAVEIGNWRNLRLNEVGVFKSEQSAWEITVYKIPTAEK